MKATKHDVRQIFRQVFEIKDLEIFPKMTAKDVETWDSLNHINLILALEERFNITFSTREIATMANVGDLFVLLNNHGIEIEWGPSTADLE